MATSSLPLASNTVLHYGEASFRVQAAGAFQPTLDVPFKQVLWASLINDVVQVTVHTEKGGIVTVEGAVQAEHKHEAERWVAELMDSAYSGVQRQRRFLAIINPHGGQGKAKSLFENKVEPILRAAQCTYSAIYTEYNRHAVKIGAELPLGQYDAILCVSGDGIIHELYNGMAEHAQPLKAFQTPIAPIPAGSGNGMSLNVLGLKEGGSVTAAALSAIKGRPMAIDMCSVVQRGKRTISVFSQCMGLMADLDLGTEHLRFLGSNRFVYGYLRGIITHKTYPYSLAIKSLETDKKKMAEDVRAHMKRSPDQLYRSADAMADVGGAALPPLRYASEDTSDWLKIEKNVLFMYGGKGAYVSRDLMQFPMSLPNDGSIDLVVQEGISRKALLTSMEGAENGQPSLHASCLYHKAVAYHAKPLNTSGYLSIDGEKYPYEEFYVEVHPGMGTLMSCYGRYLTEVNVAVDGRKA